MIKFTITARSATTDIAVEHTKEWAGPRICPAWVDKFILCYDFVLSVKDNMYYYDHILLFKDQPTFDQFLPKWLDDANDYRTYRKTWYEKHDITIVNEQVGKTINTLL